MTATKLAQELSKAIAEANQPFSVDFSTLDLEGAEDYHIKGFNKPFKKFNELLALEDWYLSEKDDSLTTDFKLRAISSELASAYQKIAKEQGKELTLKESLNEALFASEEVSSQDYYLNFTYQYSESLAEFFTLFQSKDSKAKRLAKITLFMATRYDPTWDYDRTFGLRKSQIDAVNEFILLETNNGVMPVEVETEVEAPEEIKGKEKSN